MRDIKFRAWDKKKQLFYLNPSVKWSLFPFINDVLASEPNRLVFQQYTGFKDKTGKEIYEGDILYLSYSLGHERDSSYDYYGEYKVIFQEGRWILDRIKKYDDTKNELDLYCEISQLNDPYLTSFEIIGNEFENPELFT